MKWISKLVDGMECFVLNYIKLPECYIDMLADRYHIANLCLRGIKDYTVKLGGQPLITEYLVSDAFYLP